MDTIKKEKYFSQKDYFNLANNNFKNCDFGDIQSFMAHDIFTLNIFDVKVKEKILSKSEEKLSENQLNKLVILLKYFLRTGISRYHFRNNDFTKTFVYSDNRTINKYLEILQKSDLISYSIYKNPRNPKKAGYSINPTKALYFAISLKEKYRYTRKTKKQKEIEYLETISKEEEFDNQIAENFLREHEKEDTLSENEDMIYISSNKHKEEQKITDEEIEALLENI